MLPTINMQLVCLFRWQMPADVSPSGFLALLFHYQLDAKTSPHTTRDNQSTVRLGFSERECSTMMDSRRGHEATPGLKEHESDSMCRLSLGRSHARNVAVHDCEQMRPINSVEFYQHSQVSPTPHPETFVKTCEAHESERDTSGLCDTFRGIYSNRHMRGITINWGLGSIDCVLFLIHQKGEIGMQTDFGLAVITDVSSLWKRLWESRATIGLSPPFRAE